MIFPRLMDTVLYGATLAVRIGRHWDDYKLTVITDPATHTTNDLALAILVKNAGPQYSPSYLSLPSILVELILTTFLRLKKQK